MTIILKNKETLVVDGFVFKCCIGKKGTTKNKIEGDKKTPSGLFSLGKLYYRKDRNHKPISRINSISIKKNMGWCDDINSKNYNKLIKTNTKIKHEKMFRKDYKYDYLIPINYNTKNTKLGKGSAIFIHLTKNYLPTAGCIGIKKKDMLVLLKIINKKTKIKIINN
tara:strand:- start:2385 stop:2882 length:498 start_codon:yes stop_codon:yes gene_type:complete